MLQKPDVHTQRILDLADYFDGLDPTKYNQHRWQDCICGHAARRIGLESDFLDTDGRNAAAVRDHLGLSSNGAADLFRAYEGFNPLPKQAAKVLRHLAVTGEVDWWVAREAIAV